MNIRASLDLMIDPMEARTIGFLSCVIGMAGRLSDAEARAVRPFLACETHPCIPERDVRALRDVAQRIVVEADSRACADDELFALGPLLAIPLEDHAKNMRELFAAHAIKVREALDVLTDFLTLLDSTIATLQREAVVSVKGGRTAKALLT